MQDPSGIYHWRRVDDRLTTSGQPSEAELEALQRLGVTHIINLGLHDHERALEDEARSVAALGMTYIHIPVAFDHPTEDDFKHFCAVMKGLAGTILHVHCIANLRVTAFLYRYWRDKTDMTDTQARQLMDTVWRPGGVWAKFTGDEDSVSLPHRGPDDTA